MKSYEEMAEQVLKRSEQEIKKRNIRRKNVTRIVSTLSCFCIVAVIGFGMYNKGLLDFGQHTSQQVQSTGTTGEKTENANNIQNQKPATDNSGNKEQNAGAESEHNAPREQSAQTGSIMLDTADNVNGAAETEDLTEISKEQAVKNARAKLNEKETKTITNLENPKIEEVVFEDDAQIYLFDESITATGKNLYKITYNTEQDGLLGPITFYVDKMSGIVIGSDYRE